MKENFSNKTKYFVKGSKLFLEIQDSDIIELFFLIRTIIRKPLKPLKSVWIRIPTTWDIKISTELIETSITEFIKLIASKRIIKEFNSGEDIDIQHAEFIIMEFEENIPKKLIINPKDYIETVNLILFSKQ